MSKKEYTSITGYMDGTISTKSLSNELNIKFTEGWVFEKVINPHESYHVIIILSKNEEK